MVATSRFRDLDAYRVEREWNRYEGNPLRDLFRELRVRFVRRHAASGGRVLDVGAGPGRFSLLLGAEGTRTVLLDLSIEMLRRARETGPELGPEQVDLVRADASMPPFATGSFSLVAALGNVVGYMPTFRWPSMEPLEALAALPGKVLIEIAPGFGERSAYLARLPPSVVARVLRSPVALVRARVEREGFLTVPRRSRADHGFRRFSAMALVHGTPKGWRVDETLAVAPALGFDMARLEAARGDPKAWSHLLELEEELGHRPERWRNAAAVLVALHRP